MRFRTVAAPLGLLLIGVGSLWVTFQSGSLPSGPDCAGRFRCDPLLTRNWALFFLLPVAVAALLHMSRERSGWAAAVLGCLVLLPPWLFATFIALISTRLGAWLVSPGIALLGLSLVSRARHNSRRRVGLRALAGSG
jgi:hypothetical protein